MTFKKKLMQNIFPEWKDAYISHKNLTLFLKPFKETSKIIEKYQKKNSKKLPKQFYKISSVVIASEELNKLKYFEKFFKELLSKEVEKFQKFYFLQFRTIQLEWILMKKDSFKLKNEQINKKFDILKSIYHQFWLKIFILFEFGELNITIMNKIYIKYDKIIKIFQSFNPNMFKNIIVKPILISKTDQTKLKKIALKARSFYLNLFYNNYNRNEGGKYLKNLKNSTKCKILTTKKKRFFFFFAGVSTILILLIIWILWEGDFDPDSDTESQKLFKYVFPIFRGSLFLNLYMWLLGWNVYKWTQYFINYKKIFKFNSHFSSSGQVFIRSMFFSSVFLISFLLFILIFSYVKSKNLYIQYIPLLNWLFLLFYIFFPSKKRFNGQGRLFMFKTFKKTILQSMFKVEFLMIFTINQFTSMVIPLKDFVYSICYYISIILDPSDLYPKTCMNDTYLLGFIFAFIPLLIRIIQCIRTWHDRKEKDLKIYDKINIGKFTTSAIVTILSLLVSKLKKTSSDFLFILWVIFAIFSSFYSYSWDIKMGWGLLRKGLLREKLMFKKSFYYMAIVMNLFCRFTWVLSLSPGIVNQIFFQPELFTFFIGFLEMFRRVIWNRLRVEKEFIFNYDTYKIINDIRLPKISIDGKESISSNDSSSKKRALLEKISFGSNSSLDELFLGNVNSGEEINNNLLKKKKNDYITEDIGDEENLQINEEWEIVEEKLKQEYESVKNGLKIYNNYKKDVKMFTSILKIKERNNTIIGEMEEEKKE